MSEMSVCIQNLGKYNEGRLVYKWLDLPCTDEQIKDALKSIGINAEYEEYMIADIIGMKSGEFEDIYKLNEKAELYMKLARKYAINISVMCDIENEFSGDIDDILENAFMINTKDNGYENLSNTNEIIGYFFAEIMEDTSKKLDDMGLLDYFDFEKYGESIAMNYSVFEDDENDLIILARN